MTITRITKDRYKITCCAIDFSVHKPEYSQYWHVTNKDFHINRLCDSLSEAIDFIDFIMCI